MKKSSKLNILIVDDESTSRLLINNHLSKSGHNVFTVEDGLYAIEEMKKNKYDIVIMDIKMPRMNGYEATVIIRNDQTIINGRNAIILALTSCTEEQCKIEAYNAGMDGFLTKPVTAETLLKAIYDIVQRLIKQL